jgi:mannose-6-phosphate isomerase-like protein (cupin superfamily)
MMLKTMLVLLVAACALAEEAPPPATDLTNDQIQAFLKALPRDKVSDLPIRAVDVGGYKIGVFGVFRPKSVKQDAILHQTKVTEVYQILDGSGTLVTGGTLVEPRPDAPPGTNIRGSRIEGGVSRHVAKGDMIIIPGRVPHWWSSLDGDLTYMITRPDPDGKMKLK